MKVLFLIPPAEHSLRKAHEKDNGYGLGRAYLMSYLKAHGHEVDTIPFNMCSDEEYLSNLTNKLNSFRPDFVSITMFSVNRVMGFKCIEHIDDKAWHRDIKIIVGGHHASALPEQLIKKYPFIQVVVGEGEIALLDIVEGRETGKIVQRPLIQDLDSLPFPDHKYFFDAEPGRKNATMVTSRGCPFHCSFCSLPSVSHRKYRKRSVQNVFDEIKWLKDNLPQVKNIGLQDDAFMLDNQRVIDLCKMLVENDIHFNFAVSGRVHPVSDELLYWMDKAGMHMVSIGLETGNQHMINRANKKITLEQVENYFALAKKYPKIVITTFLMVGLPGETWDTIKTTVKFIHKLQKIKYDYIYDATPTFVYPATELYEMMKEAGKIDDDYWLTDGDCPNFTLEHDLHTLMEMRRYLLKRVSFLRIFTPIGFVTQFFNAPKNLLEVVWYHPENIKYALGDSFSIMFPRMYRILRGDKIERRYEL